MHSKDEGRILKYRMYVPLQNLLCIISFISLVILLAFKTMGMDTIEAVLLLFLGYVFTMGTLTSINEGVVLLHENGLRIRPFNHFGTRFFYYDEIRAVYRCASPYSNKTLEGYYIEFDSLEDSIFGNRHLCKYKMAFISPIDDMDLFVSAAIGSIGEEEFDKIFHPDVILTLGMESWDIYLRDRYEITSPRGYS